MKGTYSALMQSKFFNPAFNSAIFDGPIRIYFAQFHESLALKIYFSLQQKYAQEMARAKEMHRTLDRTVLVMLYPTTESFQLSFDGAEDEAFMMLDGLVDDAVIGISGPFEDEKLPLVLDQVMGVVRSWEQSTAPNSFAQVSI
ncbi:MAG: hypothetical protein COT73_08980 [Bdellovibrio sp. CG10_big_fil_rev_8_21_14_0_10_47_8]|nr:MAG: hypothetical protein COT73_08980 [Bdellovibrio sp. CG10_big_fil_rev_8_21_14_0_10_47_8]